MGKTRKLKKKNNVSNQLPVEALTYDCSPSISSTPRYISQLMEQSNNFMIWDS
jgi:hypothetical protein